MRDRWNTSRLEAFSDAVFAIAITLLILEITGPVLGDAPCSCAMRRTRAEMMRVMTSGKSGIPTSAGRSLANRQLA
jgi:uncharacterized membrane protein